MRDEQKGAFSGGVDHPAYGRPHCPSCHSETVRVRNTLAWDHGTVPPTRTRYYRCESCDRRFKSVQSGAADHTPFC
jgi:transposase-like protein